MGIISSPILPTSLSEDAKWLAGEGAGSWFVLEPLDNDQVNVSRYSPIGKLECDGIFECEDVFDIERAFDVTYPSHCQMVCVVQEDKVISMTRLVGSKT